MESLVGSSLMSQKNKKATSTALKDKDLIALYFSASWCPPCKQFSPILVDFYKACSKDAKLEVVYVSSDKTIPAFEEYYAKMPWLAIPCEQGTAAIKNGLAQKLQISGIPTLIILDGDGKFITDNARTEVMDAGSDPTKRKALIESWKTKEAVPLTEATFSGSGPPNVLMQILMTFLKNPMILVGIWYFVKKFFKSMEQLADEDEAATEL